MGPRVQEPRPLAPHAEAEPPAADRLPRTAPDGREPFPGDASYRIKKLDGSWRLPEDDVLGTAAVCAIDDAANRRDLDAFRECMSQMLRRDVCRNGGVFVLYHPAAGQGGWRAACPVPEEEDDETEDESRVNGPA